MPDDFLLGEIDMRREELVDALSYHKKIFTNGLSLESKFTDLHLDFNKVNDKAQSFITVAMQYIEESEQEKHK
jgi:hypothetical protein